LLGETKLFPFGAQYGLTEFLKIGIACASVGIKFDHKALRLIYRLCAERIF
jgi:hypothetical protein